MWKITYICGKKLKNSETAKICGKKRRYVGNF